MSERLNSFPDNFSGILKTKYQQYSEEIFTHFPEKFIWKTLKCLETNSLKFVFQQISDLGNKFREFPGNHSKEQKEILQSESANLEIFGNFLSFDNKYTFESVYTY